MTEHKERVAGLSESFTSKLGKAKGVERSRIWIEGMRLVAAGFTVGSRYILKKESHGWNLELLTESASREFRGVRKVSGKADSPIIDIVGKGVHDTFGHGERVSVHYGNGLIMIRAAH